MPKQQRFPLTLKQRAASQTHYLPSAIVAHGYRAEFYLDSAQALPCVAFSSAMGQPQGVYVFQANCKVQAMEAMTRAIIDALEIINQGRI